MKFVIINETSHLFTVIVTKKIPYNFVIYIFLDFELIISFTTRTITSITISSTTKTSSTSAAFSTFKTFTTSKQIYNVLP